MMYRVYLVIVSALQILVGILAFVYLIKILIGGTITMSPVLAIPATILGLTLGVGNIAKLKRR